MKFAPLSFLSILLFTVSAFAQNDSELKTVELFSPLNSRPADARTVEKACFSFITERIGCNNSQRADISYGNSRIGEEWDWFQAFGVGSRNKIKSLGKKKWTDKFKIPTVEPYPKLKKGEQRSIVIDTSGADGADGFDAPNSSPADRISPETISRPTPKSKYHPFETARSGNMYVMRVVDEKNDFYVLFRVEELERGKRCKISWKKMAVPQSIF